MGRITKEVRPCKSCGDSYLIYDHNKWLCRDCARKRKQDRVKELSGRSDFNDLRDVLERYGMNVHTTVKTVGNGWETSRKPYFSVI